MEIKEIQFLAKGYPQRKIHIRIKEHLADIDHRRYEKSEVAYHFNKPGHKRMDDVKVYTLDFVYVHPESKRANQLRKSIEFSWIQHFKTAAPMGMIIMESRYG